MDLPLFEYDPTREALIEPTAIVKPGVVPDYCVICFFREVIDQVITEFNAKVISENRWEDGPHPVYEILYNDQRLAFFHPGIGAPMAAGLLEEVIAMGCQKFMACGGCGVLVNNVDVGNLIVVSSAIRDEGISYHYIPPAREINANQAGLNALIKTVKKHGLPYQVGKTWTTDAPYRETAERISRRREEGCISVEMEAASLMAVAQFREVIFGQVLYAGDDLSGIEWDNRRWQSRSEIRKNLFWLCADACFAIDDSLNQSFD
jgi:uridine phosphorylase